MFTYLEIDISNLLFMWWIIYVIRWAIFVCATITASNICTNWIRTRAHILSGTFINVLQGKKEFIKYNPSNSSPKQENILDMIDHRTQVCIRMDKCTDMSPVYFHRFPNINCRTYALHTRQCLNDRKHFECGKSQISFGIQVFVF